MTTVLSPKQRDMLQSFLRDGEASDLDDFISGKRRGDAFAWVNRERVIDALRRKGMLDGDDVTELGRTALGAQ